MIKVICALAFLIVSCHSARPISLQAQLASHVALFVSTWTGTGSGFPLSTTEVITAWHVVDGMPLRGVTVAGQHPITIDRLGSLDAAVLTFADPVTQTPWTLDVRPVEPAERLWCSGWGSGHHWWSEGLGTIDPDRLSLTIAPGDSGCPVLDADMEVIGIVVARGVLADHHCIIVPITEIYSELNPSMDQPVMSE